MRLDTIQTTVQSGPPVDTGSPLNAARPAGNAGFQGLLNTLLNSIQAPQEAMDDAAAFEPSGSERNGRSDRALERPDRQADAPELFERNGSSVEDASDLTGPRDRTAAPSADPKRDDDSADRIDLNAVSTRDVAVQTVALTDGTAEGSVVAMAEPTTAMPQAMTVAETIPDTGPGTPMPTAGEGSPQERVSTHVPPHPEGKQMPEQALRGLMEAGKDGLPSPNAGRPVAGAEATQATRPQTFGQTVSGLAHSGLAPEMPSGGVNSDTGSTGGQTPNPFAGQAAGPPAPSEAAPAPAAGGMPTLVDPANGAALLAKAAPLQAAVASAVQAATGANGESASSGVKPAEGLGDVKGPAAQTASAVAARPASGSSTLRAERQEMVDRLARSIRLTHNAGTTRVRLVLKPAELGTVKINLVIREGALTASLQTESPAARHLIASHLPELRASLAEQGIEVERFNVTDQSDSHGASQGRSEGERFAQPAFDSDAASFFSEDEEADAYDPMVEKQRLMAATATVDIFA